MKTCLALLVLAALPGAAPAAEVAVTGQAGFMGEWELTANARETTIGGRRNFSGPLTLRHVGLCTINGPVEKSGEITFRRTGLVWSGIEATLSFDGKQCTFAASGTKTYDGVMQCPGTRGIPLSLRLQ
jgi:hypothetical protein